MKLHNQSKNSLRWEMSKRVYTCEPWGSVEVPDQLVELCKSRRLPLAVTPVAPETKASVLVADERRAAEAAEVNQLKARVAELESGMAAASEELDRAQRERTQAVERIAELDAYAAANEDAIRSLEAERAALRKQVTELVDKLTPLEAAEAKRRAKKQD